MIAVYENGKWVSKTLIELQREFPNVSFPQNTMKEGAEWTVDGVTYAAKKVVRRPAPSVSNYAPVTRELRDVNGNPTETWVVGDPPANPPTPKVPGRSRRKERP